MGKFISGIALLLLISLPGWSAPLPVTNPSYELDSNGDGVPDGWIPLASSEAVDTDTSHAHTGEASIPLSGYSYRQRFQVVPNARYLSRAWNRGEAGGEAVVHIADVSSSTAFVNRYRQSSTVEDQYRLHGIQVKMPSNAFMARFFSMTSNGDWVWQDDVSIFDEFLRNGDIALNEGVAPEYWDSIGSPTTTITNQNARLVSGASDYFRQQFTTVPNSVFSISFEATSTSNLPAEGRGTIEASTLSEKTSSKYVTSFTASSDERRFEVAGWWPMAGTADLYVFTPVKSATYVLETHLGSCKDTVMELRGPFDPNLLIAEDDDGGSGRASRLSAFLNANDSYYCLVRPWRPDLFGTYTLTVTKTESSSPEEGKHSIPFPCMKKQGEKSHGTSIKARETVPGKISSVTSEYSITGRVVDGDGLPEFNAVVSIEETGEQTLTDTNGEFFFEGLSPAFTGHVTISDINGIVSPVLFSGPTSSILLRTLRARNIEPDGEPVSGNIEVPRALASVFVTADSDDQPILTDNYHLLGAGRDFPDFSPNGDGLRDVCTINYRLSSAASVDITVRDFSDSVLATLVNASPQTLGIHSVIWNGSGLSDGTYRIVVQASYSDGISQRVQMAVSMDTSRFYQPPTLDSLRDFLPLGVWYKWFSPPEENTEEFYRKAFSAMAAQECNSAVGETAQEHMPVLIETAETFGLKLGPIFNDLAALLSETGPDFLREEIALQAADIALRDVSDSTALLAFNVFDEPTVEISSNTHLLARALEHLDPLHRPALNVLWNRRTVDEIYSLLPPRNVFFDRYVFLSNIPVGRFGPLITDVEYYASLAESRNLPLWLVHQGFWLPDGFRFPTETETRFMAYLSLANKADGIFYFTISDFDFGLLDDDSNPRDFFRSIGDVFAQVEPISDTLLSLHRDSTSVSVSSHGYGKALLDNTDRQYIWAINSDALSNHIIQVTFPVTSSPSKVFNIIDNTPLPYRFDSGSGEVTTRVPLAPGEGALLQFIVDETVSERRLRQNRGNMSREKMPSPVTSAHIPAFSEEIPRQDRERLSHIDIAADRLLVAAGSDGLFISDCTSSSTLKSVPSINIAHDIDGFGNEFAIAQGEQGVSLYRIGATGSPVLLSNIPTRAWQVQLNGNTLAIMDGLDVVEIWDISDITNFTRISTIKTSAMIHDIALSGGFLFAALGEDGLKIYDLSETDTNGPTADVVGRFETVEAVNGSFIATGGSGMMAGEIRADGQVYEFWSNDLYKNGAIYIYQNQAMHAGTDLTYFSNVFSASAEVTCSLTLHSPAVSVVSKSNETFVCSIGRGLDIYAEGLRRGPVPSISSIAATVKGLDYKEGILYAATGGDGLTLLNTDIEGPPEIITRLTIPAAVDAVTVSGDRAWISTYDQGLYAADISEPTSPRLIFQDTGRSGNAADVAAKNEHIYVAAQRYGLKVYDDANSATPGFASRLGPVFSSKSIEIIDGHVFLTNGQGGIVQVDVTDPNVPEFVDSLDTQYAVDMTVWENNLLVADDVAGAKIIALTSEGMNLLDSVDIEEVVAVASDGPLAALVTRTSGFYLARLNNERLMVTQGPFWIGNSIPTCALLESGRLYVGFNDGRLATVKLNFSGDLTGDGLINWQDMFAFQTFWFFSGTTIPADFNNDATVDSEDLMILLESFY